MSDSIHPKTQHTYIGIIIYTHMQTEAAMDYYLPQLDRNEQAPLRNEKH